MFVQSWKVVPIASGTQAREEAWKMRKSATRFPCNVGTYSSSEILKYSGEKYLHSCKSTWQWKIHHECRSTVSQKPRLSIAMFVDRGVGPQKYQEKLFKAAGQIYFEAMSGIRLAVPAGGAPWDPILLQTFPKGYDIKKWHLLIDGVPKTGWFLQNLLLILLKILAHAEFRLFVPCLKFGLHRGSSYDRRHVSMRLHLSDFKSIDL